MSGKRTAAVTLGVASTVAALVAFAANLTSIVDFFDGGETTPNTPVTVTAVGDANRTTPPDEPEESTGPASEEASDDEVPEEFQGTWQGTIHQDGYPPYSLEVTIGPGPLDADVAEFRYPDFGCGGVWNLGAASDRVLQVVEELSYGHASCVDDVTIDLSLRSDGTVHLEAVDVAATGVLCRC